MTNTTTAYHAAKEKWKLATTWGLSKMAQIIWLGNLGTDHGWATYNSITHNLSKFI